MGSSRFTQVGVYVFLKLVSNDSELHSDVTFTGVLWVYNCDTN